LKPTILQIAPRLPPEIDGVGDYAVRLGAELRNWKSLFLSKKDFDERGFAVEPTEKIEAIILHYVGYGFHHRGIPFRFTKLVLDHARTLRVPLIVIFHELWSSSGPWRTPFYLHLLQRWLVRRLAREASTVVTSTARMQHLLQPYANCPVELLPIPSSVPEVGEVKAKSTPLKIAVFGLPANRAKAISIHAQLLQTLQRTGRLKKLISIGPEGGDKAVLSDVSIEQRGELAPEQISATLTDCDLLLSSYPADLLTKSSTAMAAFACGCPVLIAGSAKKSELESGRHYLFADEIKNNDSLLDGGNLHRVAQEAHDWYRQHASWQIVSERIDSILQTIVPVNQSSKRLEENAVLA
jgi:hypothetical protein